MDGYLGSLVSDKEAWNRRVLRSRRYLRFGYLTDITGPIRLGRISRIALKEMWFFDAINIA